MLHDSCMASWPTAAGDCLLFVLGIQFNVFYFTLHSVRSLAPHRCYCALHTGQHTAVHMRACTSRRYDLVLGTAWFNIVQSVLAFNLLLLGLWCHRSQCCCVGLMCV
ncbi:hypothetical protein COO60DRAFT_1575940, partial [Scenedesmus sp. NREL 46B-D3]